MNLSGVTSISQQYLSVWNNTAFNSQFDVFIAEGSLGLFGEYREHVPANVFRPGETIVLYMEPVGFAHEPIINTSTVDINNTEASDSSTLYQINMIADHIISDSSGTVLATIEDLPAASQRNRLKRYNNSQAYSVYAEEVGIQVITEQLEYHGEVELREPSAQVEETDAFSTPCMLGGL